MDSEKDLQEQIELEAFYKSKAGKIVVNRLKKEIGDLMFQFVSELQNPNINKYITLSCQLKEKLDIVKSFTNAGDMRKVIELSIASQEPEV